MTKRDMTSHFVLPSTLANHFGCLIYARKLRDEVDHSLGGERPCVERYHGEQVGFPREADLQQYRK